MRKRFSDDSSSLTLWFDERGGIFGIEIIFDLLLDEHVFRWIRGTTTRYVKVEVLPPRPGRHAKQALDPENLPMPKSRLQDFDDRARNLLPAWRDFIRARLLEMIEPSP